MELFTGIMLFAIIWWLVLFTVLPFGVRTAEEAEVELEPGQATSAPVRPRLLLKMVVTTAITGVIYGLIWLAIAFELIDFRQYFQ